jgi:transcriptional regulator with XRE-family HTH domain
MKWIRDKKGLDKSKKCGNNIPRCKYLPQKRREKMDFGTFIKNKRIEKGQTLREFCKKAKLDPSNWSKIERGLLPPPKSRPVLEEIALTLGLSKNSQDWHMLFDLASISYIPVELMDDAAIIDKLPIFFRTLRGEKPTRKELEDLIEKIKES